jgi:CubicO group peptidase (beta-lactamase class C family)
MEMTSALQDVLERHVANGTVPGAVASIGKAGPEIAVAGVMSIGGAPMRADAIVRIQSMTKAVTTVAALRLVEAGRLRLDDPVERWLPELADRQVLSSPTAELADTSPAVRAITLRHLLTNTSGYGMALTESPLQRAMADIEVEAGADPVAFGADEWLARLATLPLAFQPGEGWRYHHSFAILGILIARVADRPLQDHLADDLLGPLGLRDTGLWAPADNVARLPASYRHTDSGLVELEPAAGGFYAGPPPFDVSHGELVSTVHDYTRFARMLADGGRFEERQIVSEEHLRLMTSDQVPVNAKAPDSFFPSFWDGTGWGFGVSVDTEGARAGRYGWSGGLGTNFFVDPDGTVGVLLTQVEMGERMQPLLDEFHALGPA